MTPRNWHRFEVLHPQAAEGAPLLLYYLRPEAGPAMRAHPAASVGRLQTAVENDVENAL